MKKIKVNTQFPYKAVVEYGAIKYLQGEFKNALKVIIVSDEKVIKLYGQKVISLLQGRGLKVITHLLPSGESAKDKKSLESLLTLMAKENILKSDFVVALGGGTVSDLTGFACGIYKRGVPYVNLPTTLLAMCDACMGGKTAVDFSDEKNILGIIYQPSAVFCDTSFLESLSEKEIKEGLSEVIKCAIICGNGYIKKLENMQMTFENMIKFCLKLKAKVVKKDEFDRGGRKILNLGHTFAHALESCSDFTVSHGEAVAFGLVKIAEFSERYFNRRWIKYRITALLKKYQMQYDFDFDPERLYSFMLADKKREEENINLVLIKGFGSCKIKALSGEKIKEFILGR